MKTIAKILVYKLLFLTVIFCGANESGTFSKTLDVTGKGVLTSSLNFGDILVETWSKNQVRIVSNNIDDDELDMIGIKQSGNDIEFTFSGSYSYQGSNYFKFYIPENFSVVARTSAGNISLKGTLDGNFDANTSGGDIKLADILGDADIRTSGGEIRMEDINGRLKVHTSGGEIRIRNINGQSADIRTNGGEINIGDTKGEINVSTSGGDIKINSVNDGSTLTTSGGDIRVKNFKGEIRATTSGGDLVFLGGEGFLEARTSGGDITIKNLIGGCEAKTSAGSIYAEITPKSKYGSELSSSVGEVDLVLPKNADATIDVRIRGMAGKGFNSITSDFKASSYKESTTSIKATYKIGNGKENITISTVMSDINIKKR